MFNILYFIILSYLGLSIELSSANQSCYNDRTESCDDGNTHRETRREVNKYSKDAIAKYQYYVSSVEKAIVNYNPCEKPNCSCYEDIMKSDLNTFQDGISPEMIDGVKAKGTKYQVISHQLYRDKNCMFPARCAGIEHFLLELLPKLPDLELIVNTRDWPQVHKNYGVSGPVFSFSKTAEYKDIMYPAWAFWEGGPAISLYPRGIGRWDKHRGKLGKLGNSTSWSTKVPKAFFRGSRTSSERDPLVLLSRENPNIADAQYTKNQAWKSDADTLHAAPAEEAPFEEHCKYKYLFNFRGVAASFRFKHILLCKSLVFHVGNEWQEFFYPALKPWIHYIPVEASASKEEIRDLLEFAMFHDDIARQIAENGYNAIWNNLKLSHVKCYWENLLNRYAKLLNFKPTLDTSLVKIKQQ